MTKYNVGLDMSEYYKHDISDEEYRTYVFPTGEVTIENVLELYTKRENSNEFGGGSHRIVTESGEVAYIPVGWIALIWKNKDVSKSVMAF